MFTSEQINEIEARCNAGRPPCGDTEYICVSRKDVSQLAAEYRKAMEENKELRSVLQALRFGCAVSEREAEKRYGANWRDELIEKTLAGLEG